MLRRSLSATAVNPSRLSHTTSPSLPVDRFSYFCGCPKSGASLARCAQRVRPSQDPLQSLHPMEPHGCLRPDFREPCRRGRSARPAHHRFHPSLSAQDGGKPSQKGAVPRCLGHTKGGLNSKLRAVTDQDGKPLILLLTPGQMSDHKGAKLMLPQAIRATTATPSARRSPKKASSPASRCNAL